MLRGAVANGGPPRKANGKVDWSPKSHHGWTLLIFILGFLLPPLAVAARFGIGKDFFINVVLTICGYFPGHGHNFFIQNIRDNSNKNRTPKWAIRYGLVDQSANQRKAKKRSQWVGRYTDQTAERTMYDEDGNEVRYGPEHRFEDGDNPNPERPRPVQDSELLEREEFYGNGQSNSAADPYSLRRSKTGQSSLSSTSAAKPSKGRGLLGRKKADRHAKSGQVMGDPDFIDPSRARKSGRGYHGDGFGDRGSFNSSLEDERSGGGNGGGNGSGSARYSLGDDGPEDADSRYRPGGIGGGGGVSSSTTRGQPTKSGRGDSTGGGGTSGGGGGRRGGDGLDHTF